jgi:hypothetical protein
MFFRRKKAPEDKSTPQAKLDKRLGAAAKAGEAAAVEELLGQGARPNSLADGMTPLFQAAYHGDSEGHREVVRLLLRNGADANLPNKNGCTALTGAAEEGHIGVIRLLLEAGADRNHAGLDRTPLSWALKGGHPEAIALLQPPPPPEPAREENPEEVVVVSKLGNRVLEEVFSFEKNERITLVRKEQNGPVEAVTRDGFSTIEDKSGLERAFAQYAARGGKRSHDEVFGGALAKPKLSRGPEAS